MGTPGRIIDHLERGTLDLSMVRYFIIDEADEVLRMGFIEQTQTIISRLPEEHVTLLFSATMPGDIKKLCEKYLKEPRLIEVESETVTVDSICQEKYKVDEADKIKLLKDIAVLENPDSCLIFCNTQQKDGSGFQ